MNIDKIYIGDVIQLQRPKYICLNTNFYLDENNNAVLLGSVYSLLRKKQPKLTEMYGKILSEKKYCVQLIGSVGYNIVLSFPTRYHWKDQTNIKLFKKSCCELYSLIENNKLIKDIPIYIPIILENTNTITFDDLIDQASTVLENMSQIRIVACWGDL